MPRVSEMIQSKFLRKEDFDEDAIVTIKNVSLEEMPGGSDTKWVVHFNELPKGLVLNVTAIRVLEAAFGDDSDGWIGKRIKVYVDPNVSFQGKIVGGLRIQTPKKNGAAKPAPAPIQKPAEDFNDDIPF